MNTSGLRDIFKGIVIILAAASLFHLPARAANRVPYTVTEIVAPAGPQPVLPVALNDRGVVVGSVGNPALTPFIYRNGVASILPAENTWGQDINDNGDVVVHLQVIRNGVPIPLNSGTDLPLFYAKAINNPGEIAGSWLEGIDMTAAEISYDRQHAAVWSNGVVRLLGPTRRDVWTYATDINDRGVAVGVMYSSAEPDNYTAVLFRAGKMISLGTFGSLSSVAQSINNRGEILCTSYEPRRFRPHRSFIVRAGKTTELLPPPSHLSIAACALNNLGQVVGFSVTAGGEPRAFLYTDGVMHDLTEYVKPNGGWTFRSASDINDRGQIIGVGQTTAGQDRAFLLTPTTLPSVNALQDLIELVRTSDILRNQKMRLLAWLKAAQAAFEGERVQAGIRRLKVFQYKVNEPCHERKYLPQRLAMMKQPCVPPALVPQLIDAAQAIIDSFAEAWEFDLADDFSLASNPAGAWTYGYQVALSNSFIPFTFSKYNYDSYGTPVEVWAINSWEVPAIQRNATDKTVYSDGGQGTYPPGTTWFYPGPGPWEGDPAGSEAIAKQANYGVVRFTLPDDAAGNYRLVTEVKSAYTGGISGDTDFHILKNGVELFGEFLPELGATSFEDELALAAGDTIDFVIGRGADDSYHGSGLIIEARLKQVR